METSSTQLNTALVERLLARIEQLEADVKQRDAIIEQQAQTLRLYAKRIEELQQEIDTLKKGGKGNKSSALPPEWVKPSTPIDDNKTGTEPKKRKKREHNFTWTRREPTQTVEHACDNCPDCGRALCGGWEYSRHQVVEIPAITVDVVDHIVLARHCGVCGKDCIPEVDLSQKVLGQSHYGHRLVSLIAYLRCIARLPQQAIVQLLGGGLGLQISVGQISELLHRVAKAGQANYDGLRDSIRTSPYVHADETGWREDGQNGYIWSFSTPCVRYFVYDKSRGHQVPESVLGADFRGVLVSDFYSGYNYYLGPHQRCWVHLLRDVHELKQKYPLVGVLEWAAKLRDIYERAKAFSSECPKARCAARLAFQAEVLELAMPYVEACLPQSVLAKRLVAFEAELFTFVEHPAVPSQNNAAERSVRPRVIARKISGGTRSSAGSTTMAVLSSLFETWRLLGKNALEACRDMLIGSQQPMVEPAS